METKKITIELPVNTINKLKALVKGYDNYMGYHMGTTTLDDMIKHHILNEYDEPCFTDDEKSMQVMYKEFQRLSN